MNDPAISFAPPQLTFGSVELGKTEDLVLTVSNSGSLNLTVTSITSTSMDFAALETQFEVAGGASFADTIRFTPSATGFLTGALIIESNAASSPDTVLVKGTGTDVSPVHELPVMPDDFTLYQNIPNPFRVSTDIQFTLPLAMLVPLVIMDALGRTVRHLVDGEPYPPGSSSVRFDADGLLPGVYFYSLSAGNQRQTMKMVLLR